MLKELKKIRRLMYEKNREYQYGNRQFQNKTNINSEAGKKKTNNWSEKTRISKVDFWRQKTESVNLETEQLKLSITQWFYHYSSERRKKKNKWKINRP